MEASCDADRGCAGVKMPPLYEFADTLQYFVG